MIISTLLLMVAGKCTLSLGHVQQNIEEQESQQWFSMKAALGH